MFVTVLFTCLLSLNAQAARTAVVPYRYMLLPHTSSSTGKLSFTRWEGSCQGAPWGVAGRMRMSTQMWTLRQLRAWPVPV